MASFYRQIDESTFESLPATAGPWSAQSQHAGPPAALLSRAMEQHEAMPGTRLADGGAADPATVESTLEIKKSVFLTTVTRVETEEQAREFIDQRRRTNRTARHHVSAFVLDPLRTTQRSSDDGEPAGTAGAPMLEVLRGAGVSDTVAVVSSTAMTADDTVVPIDRIRPLRPTAAPALVIGTEPMISVGMAAYPIPTPEAAMIDAIMSCHGEFIKNSAIR